MLGTLRRAASQSRRKLNLMLLPGNLDPMRVVKQKNGAIYWNGRDSTCSNRELQCKYLYYPTKLLSLAHSASVILKMLTPAADMVGPVNPNLSRRCDLSQGPV